MKQRRPYKKGIATEAGAINPRVAPENGARERPKTHQNC